MRKTIYIYEEIYKELKEFRKKKKITEEKIIQMIAEDIGKYNKGIYIPENGGKIKAIIKMFAPDYEEIERVYSKSLAPGMLVQLLHNFIKIHKNDDLRRGGVKIQIYFTGPEIRELRRLVGNGNVIEFIKNKIYKE